jgi:Bacterial transcriptional regulator
MGSDGHCQSRRIHRRRASALVDEIIVLKNGSLAEQGSNWLRAPRFRSPPHTSLRPNWWLGVVSRESKVAVIRSGCGCGKSVRWPHVRTSTSPSSTEQRRCTSRRSPAEVPQRWPPGGGQAAAARDGRRESPARIRPGRPSRRGDGERSHALHTTPSSCRDTLRRALTKIRREGVAFANEEMSMGTVSVASPILASPVGAVSRGHHRLHSRQCG